MTKLETAIRYAAHRGYRVDQQGKVTAPWGNELKLYTPKKPGKKYASFGLSVEGKVVRVFVHRLQAFQKFGEAAFAPGIHTRHKDENSENNAWDNILLGTPADNSLDRAPEQRKEHAARARQKHTPEFVAAIRAAKLANKSYSQISVEFGVGKSTLSYYLSSKAKSTSYTHALNA